MSYERKKCATQHATGKKHCAECTRMKRIKRKCLVGGKHCLTKAPGEFLTPRCDRPFTCDMCNGFRKTQFEHVQYAIGGAL